MVTRLIGRLLLVAAVDQSVAGHWPTFGHWSVIAGHFSVSVDHWSVVAGHWSVVAGDLSLAAGRWSLFAARWSLAVDVGRFLLSLMETALRYSQLIPAALRPIDFTEHYK